MLDTATQTAITVWGVSLLAAASSDGGYTWTKRDEPVLLANPDIEWMDEGVAEAAMVTNADGSYTLFFTALHGEERVLGMAQSESPFGPWDIHPDPIFTPTPTVTTRPVYSRHLF